MISGYFLVNSNCDRKKIIEIISQVLMYSLTILIIFKVFFKWDISINDTLQSIFPITLKTYWFITCYIILYLLAPFINIIFKNTNKKEIEFIIIFLTVISWVSSILYYLNFDVIDTTKGYGIIWLINLYMIAGYIRLYISEEYNKNKFLMLYILLSFIIYGSRFFILMFNKNASALSDIFYCYNSITVTTSSICLFMFFKKIKINCKWLKSAIIKVAPLTFATYIIHEHPIIKKILYRGILHTDNFINSKNFVIVMLLSCIIIYLICCFIEFLRRKLINSIKKLYIKIKNLYLKKLECKS